MLYDYVFLAQFKSSLAKVSAGLGVEMISNTISWVRQKMLMAVDLLCLNSPGSKLFAVFSFFTMGANF